MIMRTEVPALSSSQPTQQVQAVLNGASHPYLIYCPLNRFQTTWQLSLAYDCPHCQVGYSNRVPECENGAVAV